MAQHEEPFVTSLDGEVRRIISRRLYADEADVAWEAAIASIADAADLPELWLALEDEFDIELTGDDLEAVRTPRDVVDVVRSRLIERARDTGTGTGLR